MPDEDEYRIHLKSDLSESSEGRRTGPGGDSMAEPDPVDATDPRPAGLRVVVTLVAAALPVLGGIWVMDIPAMLGFVVFTEQTLAVMLELAIALVFLNVPADRGQRHRLPWYDAVAAAVGSGTLFHVANDYPRLDHISTGATAAAGRSTQGESGGLNFNRDTP